MLTVGAALPSGSEQSTCPVTVKATVAAAPLVSVVLPAYNAGAFIEATLASLADQCCANLEVIVVDDGSVDDTQLIARRARGPAQVRIIAHEANRGVSAAVNTGVAAALGEFVAFIGHDDLWRPGKLARQLGVFALDSTIDACYCDFEEFGAGIAPGRFGFDQRKGAMRRYPRREIAPGVFAICSSSFLEDLCRVQATILPSTLLIRRAVLDRVLPLDEDVTIEDVQMNFRLANQARFAYVDEPLALRRIHARNWSGVMGDMKWLDAHVKTLKRLDQWVTMTAAERRAVATLLAGHCSAAGYTSFLARDMASSRRYFATSIKARFSVRAFLYLAAALLPLPVIELLRQLKRRIAESLGGQKNDERQ